MVRKNFEVPEQHETTVVAKPAILLGAEGEPESIQKTPILLGGEGEPQNPTKLDKKAPILLGAEGEPEMAKQPEANPKEASHHSE